MGADLIVMGIRGRPELAGAILGSAAAVSFTTPPGPSSWAGSGRRGRRSPNPRTGLCRGQSTGPPSADREPANPRQRCAVQAPRRSFRSSWCHRPRQRLRRLRWPSPAAPCGTSRSPSVCGPHLRAAGLVLRPGAGYRQDLGPRAGEPPRRSGIAWPPLPTASAGPGRAVANGADELGVADGDGSLAVRSCRVMAGIIRGGGHLFLLERPTEIAAPVADFLKHEGSDEPVTAGS
jgi:hypothetical protein